MAGVEDPGDVACGFQAIYDVRADEARAARDQDTHRGQSRGKLGATPTALRGIPEPMTTVLIIIAVLIVLAALVTFIMRRRRAERDQLRERLNMEAQGHRQELEANSAKALESEQQAEQHRRQFEEHRDEADRLRREAEEKERLAEEHATTASELDGRSERARTAASRHDERASDVEERLGKL
jgi:flagellar biosynthesis/type III secretory pathway M-ring protein FliF/YscJ